MADVKKMEFSDETGWVDIEKSDGGKVRYNLADVVSLNINETGDASFDEVTTSAIISIAGEATGSSTQAVDGYPVEVTGTTEVVVSIVPCDIVWIAHNGVPGTISIRDASVSGSNAIVAKTIDMATSATLQPGMLRTQYGVSVILTAGKATFWVRPL